MKKTKTNSKAAKIQSIVLIVSGFVLIFALLSATILYTYYDRSLVNFIQGIGREDSPDTEPEPEPVNPALLGTATATKEYTDNLYILSDATISGISSLDVSIKDRCFYTQFISSTNYNEAKFTSPALSEQSFTIAEFVAEYKPKYLLLNFSGTGLTMTTDAITNLYSTILDIIFDNSPETVVVLSGSIPVTENSNVNAENVVTLDTILAGFSWQMNDAGKNVFYLPSPSSFYDNDKKLKDEYQNEDGALNEKGCQQYFDYVLKHPVAVTSE